MTLDKYQEVGRDFLSSRPRALLGDTMGLGKTAQALTAMNVIAPTSILIVCPKNVRPGWVRELQNWTKFDISRIHIVSSRDPRPRPGLINIVHYDLVFRPKVFKALKQGGPYDLVICDEAHKLKNHEAKRTMALLDPRSGFAHDAKFLWMLTGTPLLNRPSELFPLIRALDPKALGQYTAFFKFAQRFCGAYKGKWGWDFSGATNLKELSALLKPIMLRRSAAEAGLDIRTPRQQLVLLDRPETVTDQDLEREKKAYRDPHNTLLGDLATLRSGLALQKVGQVSLFARDVLESVNKVVIFAHHVAVVNALASDLEDFKPAVVNGKTRDKQAEIDRFIKDPSCRVYIGNYEASAEGVDGLQHVCSTMITAELIWTPKIIEQAIGRLARRGQNDLVNVFHCIIQDSADEEYIEALIRKENVSNEILTETETAFKLLNTTRSGTVETTKLPKGQTMFTLDQKAFDAAINAALDKRLSKIEQALEAIGHLVAAGVKEPKAKKSEGKIVELATAPAPAVAAPVAIEAVEAVAAPVVEAIVEPVPAPAPVAAPVVDTSFDMKKFAENFNGALSAVRKKDIAGGSTFAAECRKLVKEKTGADGLALVTDPAVAKPLAAEIIARYNAAFGKVYGELTI